MEQPESVSVDFGFERQYVFDILTSDISVADALLDLIDNSIDAARRNILRQSTSPSKSIPSNYSGYEIKLYLDSEKVVVDDNCHGIEEHLLTRKAFRLGARHEQEFSIGMYGVGLPRAFWKLGSELNLFTDNGDNVFTLDVKAADLVDSDTQTVDALKRTSQGQQKNTITIRQIKDSARSLFSDQKWIKDFVVKASRVFGLCVKKGLVIKINDLVVPEFGPGVRENGPAKKLYYSKQDLTSEGVKYRIISGLHEKYKLPTIEGDDVKNDKEITRDFGWYVVCNDRIVLIADHSVKVGWESKWHQEYNGFVGWLLLESSDPNLLPWDTTKTDLNMEKASRVELAPILKSISDSFRQTNRKMRKDVEKENSEASEASKPDDSQKSFDLGGKPNEKATKADDGDNLIHFPATGGKQYDEVDSGPTKTTYKDHNQNWDTLLPKGQPRTIDKKLNALVFEATTHKLSRPYGGSMLFRAIMERAITIYLRKNKLFGKVCNAQFEAQAEQGRPFSEAAKKNYKPTLSTMLDWLKSNADVFPSELKRELANARKKFADALSNLNGVTHEGDFTNEGLLKTQRDEAYPLLEFMLKNLSVDES